MVHLRDGAWCTAGLFSHVQWKTQPWSSAVALSVPDIELNTTPTATVSWTSLSWTFVLPKSDLGKRRALFLVWTIRPRMNEVASSRAYSLLVIQTARKG